jgi:hypothetical protein
MTLIEIVRKILKKTISGRNVFKGMRLGRDPEVVQMFSSTSH